MINNHDTEQTPLLPEVHNEAGAIMPPLSPVLDILSNKGPSAIQSSDLLPSTPFPTTSQIPPELLETSFALNLLLHLYQSRARKPNTTGDIYEEWREAKASENGLEALERHLNNTWDHFLDQRRRSNSDIDAILWTEFPIHNAGIRKQRVVDFFSNQAVVPASFLSHPIISLALLRRWKYGASISVPRRGHVLEWYDSMSTPHTMQLLELISMLIYTSTLIEYAMHPPKGYGIFVADDSHLGFREIFLLVFAVSSIARLGCSLLSPLFLLLAFLVSSFSPPKPGFLSFNVLLLGLCIQILQLFSPTSPSLLYLYPIKKSVPLVIFIRSSFLRAFTPTIALFLPIFLFVFFLLSYSLADTLPPQGGWSLLFSDSIGLVPMESRTAFLILLGVVLLLMFSTLFILTISHPTCRVNSWDQFSLATGLMARKMVFNIIISYSGSYLFPIPFNLVQLLAIKFPTIFLAMVGIRGSFLEPLERYLWRSMIGPMTVTVSTIVRIVRSLVERAT